MRPILFYTDHHELPLPEGHRFPIRKYRMLRELLEQDDAFELRPAPLADPATIELAHDREYVAAFVSGALSAAAIRRIGFPWSKELVQRTQASVGATLAATQVAIQQGFSGTLAGGTHHAFRAEGSGYCVFNDIAVAIETLRSNGTHSRFTVIDLDVHQGDGTAQIFEDDQRVFTFSMHGGNNFPFRKQRSTLDIELADGIGDEEYLSELGKALPRVLEHRPEIIFYQAGADPLESDRLGRLKLSLEGLRQRDILVFEAVREAGLPMVITLGGGYSDPIERTAEAHAQTFRTARQILSSVASRNVHREV